jgi:hypothetical protein
MATNKLTDAQRVILAAAAARESGLVLPLPKSLGDNRGTIGVILKSLLTRGLITERQVRPDEEPWRGTAETGRTTLVISAEGLQLMGIDPIGEVIDEGAEGNINADDGSIAPDQRHPADRIDAGAGAPASGSKVQGVGLPKEGTKLGALIAALRKPGGATIPELMEATGWQAHSVRGAISGNLKKKLDLQVVSEVVENRGRVYRIATGGSAE